MKSILKKVINQDLILQLRDLQRNVKSIPYRMGNAVECPCCGGKYKAFMPFRYRQNAQCPDCKSLERHRYIFLTLRDKQHLFEAPPKKVLHFAPDICLLPHFKNNPNIEYVTADYMTSFTSSITVKPDFVMSGTITKIPMAMITSKLSSGNCMSSIDITKSGLRLCST